MKVESKVVEVWKNIDSSLIEAIKWDEPVVIVTFQNERAYLYNISSSQEWHKHHDDWLNAESMGRYFTMHIKGKYPYIEVPY